MLICSSKDTISSAAATTGALTVTIVTSLDFSGAIPMN